jgi:rhodanese-related sulfurtransferase
VFHAPFAVTTTISPNNDGTSAETFEGVNMTTAIIIVIVLAALILIRRAGQISTKEALAHLKNGALVIDVRTPSEYSSDHLPSALNIPLNQIETTLPCRVKDKSLVLLLHCQSGIRSGLAKRKLKALGYSNAFNLGSYDRAANIVGNE